MLAKQLFTTLIVFHPAVYDGQTFKFVVAIAFVKLSDDLLPIEDKFSCAMFAKASEASKCLRRNAQMQNVTCC